MKKKCHICKEKSSAGGTIVHGGKTYSLCKECLDALESVPQQEIPLFLEADHFATQIGKSMWEARKKRARGEKLWG
jgi:hypothetical protein